VAPAVVDDGRRPALARAQAKPLAEHIARSGYSYDRRRLATWQRYAGIAPDGIYGPASRAELVRLGVADAPKPLFKGKK
jgi:peptidoglycan hydrolase-like protein with peptidoglycan-binding domain